MYKENHTKEHSKGRCLGLHVNLVMRQIAGAELCRIGPNIYKTC